MIIAALLAAASLQQGGLDRAETKVSLRSRHADTIVAPNGDVLECRVQKVTGSHFTARYCLTAEQWQRLHDNSMQALYGRSEPHPMQQSNAEDMNPH